MVSRSVILISLFALILAGCTYVAVDNSTNDSMPVKKTAAPQVVEEVQVEYAAIISGVEGDLITLKPEAQDPDGDEITYTFSRPFNADGQWQTKLDDEGEYVVTVTAFDGVDSVSEEVLVKVTRGDRVPVIDCPVVIEVNEGEYVKIDCGIYDPEGNEVVVKYEGYMTSSMKHIGYDEAGDHKVDVTAWDKENVDSKVHDSLTIHVVNVNRPPVVALGFDGVLNANEGDLVTVNPVISDDDGEVLRIRFSNPFDANGNWQTEIGDEGVYDVSVTVSDGENSVTKEFVVNVETSNTAPVLRVNDVYVNEGETIRLKISASDREDKDLKIVISGAMDSETEETDYEDAYSEGCDTKGCTARYSVTVSASDGRAKTTQTVTVHVKDVNRPPVFVVPA